MHDYYPHSSHYLSLIIDTVLHISYQSIIFLVCSIRISSALNRQNSSLLCWICWTGEKRANKVKAESNTIMQAMCPTKIKKLSSFKQDFHTKWKRLPQRYYLATKKPLVIRRIRIPESINLIVPQTLCLIPKTIGCEPNVLRFDVDCFQYLRGKTVLNFCCSLFLRSLFSFCSVEAFHFLHLCRYSLFFGALIYELHRMDSIRTRICEIELANFATGILTSVRGDQGIFSITLWLEPYHATFTDAVLAIWMFLLFCGRAETPTAIFPIYWRTALLPLRPEVF